MSKRSPGGSLPAFFLLACAISWTIWSPLWLRAFGVDFLPVLPVNHALGSFGPAAAALIVSGFEEGRSGPAALFRRMGAWRGRAGWILLGLTGPFLVLGVAMVWTGATGGGLPPLGSVGVSAQYPMLPAWAYLLFQLVTFGYGEETGWRGFALPRLQRGHTALGATAWLTVGWALWHLPLFLYRPTYASMGPLDVLGWLVSLFTGAVLLTWLFNESRGSILVVALFHASMDAAFVSDASSAALTNATGAIIMAWGLVVLMAAGPRLLSRKGKVTGPAPGSTSAAPSSP